MIESAMEAQRLLHLAGLLNSDVVLPGLHPVPNVTRLSLAAFLQCEVNKVQSFCSLADEKNGKWIHRGHRRPGDWLA